jgi:hypothetical protein
MGLDIIAVSNVVKMENPTLDGWDTPVGVHADTFKAYHLRGFERSFRGLEEEAWYMTTDESDMVDFRAGSYGGYNKWRDHLATFGVGVPAAEIWANTDKYQDGPFFELINFADNEGSIGPDAARDLDIDFAVNRDDVEQKARAHFTDDGDFDWFMQKYDDWAEAFKIARNQGLVYFC